MKVSVVVTCYNEEKNIRECLNTLIRQTYPLDQYEIVVVDGGSQDKTQAIATEFTGDYSNMRLVVEHKKGTAAGRNAGVNAARYDCIAFIDADCQAPPDWLSLLVENYQRAKSKFDNVIVVGGRNIAPKDAGSFPRAVEIVLDSYIGSFNSIQGRQFKSSSFVPGLSTVNALYDKKKIIEIGYFDESLQNEAEDADLNFRLFSAGYRFLFIPDSFVWHRMRPTPKTWLKNMFRYGKGRARLLKRYPQMWNISYLLPPLFIFFLLTTLLTPFSGIFYIPLVYFPALFVFSVFQCLKKKQPLLTLEVMLVYLIQHFGYAIGELYGLVSPRVK